MKKIMLIGGVGSDKGRLVSLVSGGRFVSQRIMAVQYYGSLVITPDEFLENRRFYPALIATSQNCDILVMLQSAKAKNSVFPPLFATIFTRRVVGVITHAEGIEAHVARARRFLQSAGARNIFIMPSDDAEAVGILQKALHLQN